MGLRSNVCRLGLLLALLVTGGCAAHRTAPPPSPKPAVSRADLATITLYLRSFELLWKTSRDGVVRTQPLQDEQAGCPAAVSFQDSPARVHWLQETLLDYVFSEAAFRDITYNLSGRRQQTDPALDLTVRIELSQVSQHTYILDILNGVAFVGLFPLVPCWGNVQIVVEASIGRADSRDRATYRHVVQAPYSAMFFGWYRRGPLAEAYARAYEEVFRQLAQDIAASAPRLTELALSHETAPLSPQAQGSVATNSPDSAGEDEARLGALLHEARSAPPLAQTDPSALLATEAPAPADTEITVLDPRGFSVISEPRPKRLDGSLAGYLRLLGGVEASAFAGVAHVSSSVRNSLGESVEVASGNAYQSGYRFALYGAPETTGFFIVPALGFLSQRISNIDIRSSLPRPATSDPRDIPAVVTDPATGKPMDPGSPNEYQLTMQSGYGGARVGYDLVAGTPRFVLFASANLGLNVVEYRSIKSHFAGCASDIAATQCRGEQTGWAFLQSGSAGGTIGLSWPRAHFGVRLIADYELYRKFKYYRPLEVRGPATYNAQKNTFEHPRVWMRGASLDAWSFQFAAAALF